ncbi:MAG TPA: HEAT repeat domain-containing protein [Planctomycetota bacterium]|nr:HEAT repeat domain-containing protein [Planctomycetota bacterium]
MSKPRDPASVGYVVKALRDKRSDVRAAAAIAAGRVVAASDDPSVKALVDAQAAEGDAYARRMMLIALGRVGSPMTVAVLASNLQASERQDRAFAALGLGLARATEQAPALRKAFLDGGDQSFRGAVAVALALMRDPEALPLMVDYARKSGDVVLLSHVQWALVLSGDRAAADAAERVHREARDHHLRAASALATGFLGHTPSQPALFEQLRVGGDRIVRGSAATALGRMGDVMTIEPLLRILEGEREQDLSRAYAATALGILGRRDAAPELARLYVDADASVRHEALDYLRDVL